MERWLVIDVQEPDGSAATVRLPAARAAEGFNLPSGLHLAVEWQEREPAQRSVTDPEQPDMPAARDMDWEKG